MLLENDATYYAGRALDHVKQQNFQQAAEGFAMALTIKPEDEDCQFNLASCYIHLKNWVDAEHILKNLYSSNYQPALVTEHLAITLFKQQKKEAFYFLKKALILSNFKESVCLLALKAIFTTRTNYDLLFTIEQSPHLADYGFNTQYYLGSLSTSIGRIEQAIGYFKHCHTQQPHSIQAAFNLLCLHNCLDGFDGIAQQKQTIAIIEKLFPYSATSARAPSSHAPSKPLQHIGFISGDFKLHSCFWFMKPLLEYLRGKYHLSLFSNVAATDDYTNIIRHLGHDWYDIHALNDADAAALIHKAQADILIDLSGLTEGHRMGILAQRPANCLQLNWLGYPATTGLATMDGRIVDWHTDPAGTDNQSSEQLLRLPRSFLCYHPPDDLPAINYQPATQIRFGSFNQLMKLSDHCIGLWAEILRALPTALLVLKNHGLADITVQQYILQRFAQHGISPHQLSLLPHSKTQQAHFLQYQYIDIALDSFPYHGTTTSLEALYMGVPVISLAGTRHGERVGVSILQNLGAPELIAYSDAEYIQKAVNLANNPDLISQYHRDLRPRLRQSVLMDPQQFGEDFMAAVGDFYYNRNL